MSETVMHVVGNVGTDVDHKEVAGGTHFCSFRLAATPRYYDRSRRAYVDGVTNWLTVHCWRYLAWHVFQSIHRGDPVVVVGRLRTEESAKDGQRCSRLILEASTVGHDLSQGVSDFTKRRRSQDRGPDDDSPAPPAPPGPAVGHAVSSGTHVPELAHVS